MMSHGDGVSGLLCMSQGNGEMTARERRQPIYSMGCYFHIIRGEPLAPCWTHSHEYLKQQFNKHFEKIHAFLQNIRIRQRMDTGV